MKKRSFSRDDTNTDLDKIRDSQSVVRGTDPVLCGITIVNGKVSCFKGQSFKGKEKTLDPTREKCRNIYFSFQSDGNSFSLGFVLESGINLA